MVFLVYIFLIPLKLDHPEGVNILTFKKLGFYESYGYNLNAYYIVKF
jgi:hypothetical protein